MVKCVVSGCPNRRLSATRGAFSRNRPPKRFFSFPQDPARVKVWLAALRETDRWDLSEEHLICEDHFLPEDISPRGVSADAIPLMPPCLDEGTISRWGGDSSEEEEEEEEEQQQQQRRWTAAVKLPVVNPPQPVQHRSDPPKTSVKVRDYEEKDAGAEKTKEDKSTSETLCQRNETVQTTKVKKPDIIVQVLTQGLLELLLTAPGGELDLRQAATKLDTSRQRVNDITNVLSSINLIKKLSNHTVQWIGSCPIRSFLWTNQDFENELEDMKLDEETLDDLISGCSVELLQLTEDRDNCALAYVSHQDLRRLSVLREQTVMVVKAPEETTLKVSAPTEDRIQVHMKGAVGPIKVLTSDIGLGDVEVGEKSSCFITLEESRVKMAALHTEWSCLSAVQSYTG